MFVSRIYGPLVLEYVCLVMGNFIRIWCLCLEYMGPLVLEYVCLVMGNFIRIWCLCRIYGGPLVLEYVCVLSLVIPYGYGVCV